MTNNEYGYAVLRNMRTCRRLENVEWVGATWKYENGRSTILTMVSLLATIAIIIYMSF